MNTTAQILRQVQAMSEQKQQEVLRYLLRLEAQPEAAASMSPIDAGEALPHESRLAITPDDVHQSWWQSWQV